MLHPGAELWGSGPGNAGPDKSPVVKSLGLLAYLANSQGPVGLSDLSRALGLPKATVHRLAGLLEGVGFLHRDPATLRYSVGPRFEDIALAALRSGGGARRRRLLMDQLAQRLGVRTNFAVLKAGRLIFVEWVESRSPIRIDLQPGTEIPAHCSASGKLLLAYGPEELRERFLAAAPFRASTKSTITDAAVLRGEFALIRRRGYAEDNEEFLPGIVCLAVPVRNGRGEVVAGLGVMAPAHDFPLQKARENLALIRACADDVSAEAGWSGMIAEEEGTLTALPALGAKSAAALPRSRSA